MRSEISQKWSKDDLVAQVQSKRQLDEARAQKDVDTFANGRRL
jgi:hypothetical protein